MNPIKLFMVLNISMILSPASNAAFNIPTATVNPTTGIAVPVPSPLCIPANSNTCATEFTAKILMFEEFGTKSMPSSPSISPSIKVLPPPVATAADPTGCTTTPDGAALDSFIKEQLNPIPTEEANIDIPNAWDSKVKSCVPGVVSTVGEGRPSGVDFAHQRWNEFPAVKYFQSAQTGVRINGGLRDNVQMHGYTKGEFGPTGLYYLPGGTTAGISPKMHPNLPIQDPNSVWTYDGTLPPKLLMAKYGEPLIFRHWNALPIDIAANNGFGRHTISTHEHNGHNPAESDGFMHAYTYPGQFYDYHWPMVLAGHDSINIGAADAKTGAPDDKGGITKVPGDWHETMSTHWFHDHMLDYTAQNVYKGNAAMMNYYSAIDRGREPASVAEANNAIVGKSNPGYACHYANAANANLCLPSGSGMDWGNRDYDVNLVIADKAWDDKGQLKFNIFNTDGFLGDRMTVNWQYKPYIDVRARKYRFRLLNGAVSRDIKVAIVKETIVSGVKTYTKVPFHMIANDGNIMQHAIPFPNKQSLEALPEQAIGERYDIVVDFKGMAPGTKLYMVNILEHESGVGPAKILSLSEVLGAKLDGVKNKKTYKADGINGDPVVGKFLEIRVAAYAGTDFSMNPKEYEETTTLVNGITVSKAVPGKQMIPMNKPTAAELKAAIHRTFDFGRSSGTDISPWTIKTDKDSGGGLTADPHRISAAPTLPNTPTGLGKVEIWHITGSPSWTHPVHVHFEEGQILKRGGVAPPIWEKYARKDIYRVGPISDSTTSVDIAIRFREFAGTYVEHCHNTQHEDHAMLLRWDLEHPGNTVGMATPMPDWNGVQYESSIYLPTAKVGDTVAKKKFVLP